MRVKILIIWSIILLWNLSSCNAKQNTELNMLIVKDSQINVALNEIIREETEYGGVENEIIIIRVERNSNEIKMGSLSEKSLSSYLTGKKDKPFGYFEIEGVTVVVFGENENVFFEKTNDIKDLPFLVAKPVIEVKEGEIPPPPVIYEPIVWVYTYENGKLKLIDKGRFTLLI